MKGTLWSFTAEHQKKTPYGKLSDYLNPALFITMANKDYNPTFEEAMASPEDSIVTVTNAKARQ